MGLLMTGVPVATCWPWTRTDNQHNNKHNNKHNTTTTIYRYNICNGLSNQLLFHATSLARAIRQGATVVEIPNSFILDGTQSSDRPVYPQLARRPDQFQDHQNHNTTTSTSTVTMGPTIPLDQVLDTTTLMRRLHQHYGLTARLVQYSTENSMPSCPELGAVQHESPRLVQQLLDWLLRPAPHTVQPQVDELVRRLQQQQQGNTTTTNRNGGVCLHHRNGWDWHHHCARWSSIPDGVYRGNCLNVTSMGQALQNRLLLLNTKENNHKEEVLVYYCGDHEIPTELRQVFPQMTNRAELVVASNQPASWFAPPQPQFGTTRNNNTNNTSIAPMTPPPRFRDWGALLDFFVCQRMSTFVGNSVSTFSALQIALRLTQTTTRTTTKRPEEDDNHHNTPDPPSGGGGVYWYNTQSIPLASMWRVFSVPLLYTYTERSEAMGKYLLQASIASVRKVMPHTPIHLLYHGDLEDQSFQTWLQQAPQNVHLHFQARHPPWSRAMERMRQHHQGKRGEDEHNNSTTSTASSASPLFLHAGNYFGTWQRLDLPLYVPAEYGLLLDADTIVHRPFTMADLGLNLTYSIAMSAESDLRSTTPTNAGVTLMNLPYLRQTHEAFSAFVLDHVDRAFDHPSPSDQGAYLDYYKDSVQFLDPAFNFKPYWEPTPSAEQGGRRRQGPFILHFHGPKPHDYIRFLLGESCHASIHALCVRGVRKTPIQLCHSLTAFAQAVAAATDTRQEQPLGTLYCTASLGVGSWQAAVCTRLLQHFVVTQPAIARSAGHHDESCANLSTIVHTAIDSIPWWQARTVPRAKILKRLGLNPQAPRRRPHRHHLWSLPPCHERGMCLVAVVVGGVVVTLVVIMGGLLLVRFIHGRRQGRHHVTPSFHHHHHPRAPRRFVPSRRQWWFQCVVVVGLLWSILYALLVSSMMLPSKPV